MWKRALATALAVFATVPATPATSAHAAAGRPMVFAGTGTAGSAGDGGAATEARLANPAGVAVADDGTVYISDSSAGRVRAVSDDGTISTVVGGGRVPGPNDRVDEHSRGTAIGLRAPKNLAVGPDGTLYIADVGLRRVFSRSPKGVVSLVAGNGTAGFSGDGGPATKAALGRPDGLAVGPDGTVYIGDTANHRIRAVSPTGVITTVAGNGGDRLGAAGGTATTVAVPQPSSLAVDEHGAVWVVDAMALQRLKDGRLSTAVRAGKGRWRLSNATSWPPTSPLNGLSAVAADGDGVYVAGQDDTRVTRLADDHGLGSLARLGSAFSPLVGQLVVSSGTAYFAAPERHRVYRMQLSATNSGSSMPWWPFVVGGVVLLLLIVGLGVLLRRRRR